MYKIDLVSTPVLERKDFYVRNKITGSNELLRHYVSRDDDGMIVATAVGVTSFIGKSMPSNPRLEAFKMSFGSETAYWIALNTMAYYGTLMHMVAEEISQGADLTLDDDYIIGMFKLNQYTKEEGGLPEYKEVTLPAQFGEKRKYDIKRFRRDALAIYQFFQDVESNIFSEKAEKQSLTLVGVESTFSDFIAGYAGTADFIFRYEYTIKKKEFVEYHIFDLKTGANHYLSHALQQNAYISMVKKHFNTKLVYAWCVHMKDYKQGTLTKYLNGTSKTTPYNVVKIDQNEEELNHYLRTYKMNYSMPKTNVKEINYSKKLSEITEQIKGEQKK